MKLAQLNRDLESMGLGDPELQRKLQELQNLMDKLAPDNRQDRSKELIERTKDMNAIEAGETLSELSADQDALRDRLEEVLETFKRAAMEQDFRAVAAEADELARPADMGDFDRLGDGSLVCECVAPVLFVYSGLVPFDRIVYRPGCYRWSKEEFF